MKGRDRSDFLRLTAGPRMARLTELVDALAKPWTDFYIPTPVDDTWYRSYKQ